MLMYQRLIWCSLSLIRVEAIPVYCAKMPFDAISILQAPIPKGNDVAISVGDLFFSICTANLFFDRKACFVDYYELR